MNLVAFSVKTKGVRNFGRRLWTVFSRFGVTETRSQRTFDSILDALARHGAAPTFFIPATVLARHPALMARIARQGAEVGIHGYVHNDYRSIDRDAQREQVRRAIAVFAECDRPFRGFRNPYLGWTEDSVAVFDELGFAYDSNEAVVHDVLNLDALTPQQRDGFARSLQLFQAIPCSAYTLRPHLEGRLARIPTSIPDDEMLLDRLRLRPEQIGALWSTVMRRIYDLGGIYVLNLHPERGLLCRPSLDALLATATGQALPVWIARLDEVAAWWQERASLRVRIGEAGLGHWHVEAPTSSRATVVVRGARVVEGEDAPWHSTERRLITAQAIIAAERRPCIALSPRSTADIADFLDEQGFPYERVPQAAAESYALWVDLPEGLGTTREQRIEAQSALLRQIVEADAPLVYLGAWPEGRRAALCITGDVDSITIQDFFLRIGEVAQQHQATASADVIPPDTHIRDADSVPVSSPVRHLSRTV